MSTPMEQAVEVLCQYLQDQGLPARTAWPAGDRPQMETPVISVSLRGCESAPAGFSGYLGQRLNPDTQQWEERYGKTVTLTFALDLYAAPGTDPTALEQTWAALAQACLPPGPKGLAPGAFSCGETDYDQQARLLATAGEDLRPDVYSHSSIRNLYLDTPDFRLIRRSLEKPVYKEKLRLRSYGRT